MKLHQYSKWKNVQLSGTSDLLIKMWKNYRKRACYHLEKTGLVGQSIFSGEDKLETGFVADQRKSKGE